MIHKSYKEKGKAKINSCHDRDPFLINLLFFLEKSNSKFDRIFYIRLGCWLGR